MALEYQSKTGLEQISPIIDEYVVWYGRTVRAYLEQRPMEEDAPPIFSEWLADAGLPRETSQRAKNIYDGMIGAARDFAMGYSFQSEPPLKQYNEFSKHYEEFIQFMHRLEIDLASENSGFDKKTGLRSARLLHEDMKRELERRSRRGNPLAIALIKMNETGDLSGEGGNAEALSNVVCGLSSRIKSCLRSFDDAYYLGEEFFLLSLKHADMLGAQAAIRRLNAELERSPVLHPIIPRTEISVSSVLHEPEPGDSVDALITHMKKDLDGLREKGAVIQYNDLSPLQRFIHSTENKK